MLAVPLTEKHPWPQLVIVLSLSFLVCNDGVLVLGEPSIPSFQASGSDAPLGVAQLRQGLLASFQYRSGGMIDGLQACLCLSLIHLPY